MAQSTKSRKMGLPEVREPAQGWKRGQSSDLNPGQPNSQFSVEAHTAACTRYRLLELEASWISIYPQDLWLPEQAAEGNRHLCILMAPPRDHSTLPWPWESLWLWPSQSHWHLTWGVAGA